MDADSTDQLGELLGRRLSYEVVLLHATLGERLGLSITDHKYLDLIDREGPLSAGELGRLTGLASGSITALVDRLASAGVVVRRRDPDDRRRVVIAAEGPRLAEIGAVMGGLGRRMAPIVARHSPEELATVAGFLADLVEAMAETRRDLDREDAPGPEPS